MWRLAFCLSPAFVLFFGTTLQAGAIVSLVPWSPVNGVSYAPDEVVHVDFYMQMDPASPPSIRVRLLQFDLSDSSPELTFFSVRNHPQADVGPIPFWNFQGAPSCATDETRCGITHFIDGNLEPPGYLSEDDRILAIAYYGTNLSNNQIVLRQSATTLVGSLNVTMPSRPGNYVLDVLNADSADPGRGAQLWYGFGLPSDPERVQLWAHTGGIIMSADGAPGTDEFGRVAFAVVPEPTALALLGVGAAFILQARKKGQRQRCLGPVLA